MQKVYQKLIQATKNAVKERDKYSEDSAEWNKTQRDLRIAIIDLNDFKKQNKVFMNGGLL